jgi:hypothetical protein
MRRLHPSRKGRRIPALAFWDMMPRPRQGRECFGVEFDDPLRR